MPLPEPLDSGDPRHLPGGTGLTTPASAVRRGLKVVDQWCSMCHSISRRETDPERAPTFAAIMQREGRDKAYLATFLEKDHFPMTTYRLFDHEKRDVVSFLLWLKQGE